MPRNLARLSLFLAQPDFCAELGGIVNIESLVELSRQFRDGGGLDAESIRDHRFRLAQDELNADFRLRRRGAAFPQDPRRMSSWVFKQFGRHGDKAALWILGSVFGNN